MKKNELKIFDWLNIMLSTITIISFILILIFLIISLKNQQSVYVNLCNICIGVFTGFFVSTIIRVNDMHKQKTKTESSFNVIKPQLKILKGQIEDFYPHFKQFVKVNSDNTIDAYDNRIFFVNLTEADCTYDFIDLDYEFIKAKNNIYSTIEELYKTPIFKNCSYYLQSLIVKIKSCSFFKDLTLLVECNQNKLNDKSKKPIDYKHLSISYSNFEILYNEICKILNERKSFTFRKQTILEINKHKEKIKEYSQLYQIPTSETISRIVYDNFRVQ